MTIDEHVQTASVSHVATGITGAVGGAFFGIVIEPSLRGALIGAAVGGFVGLTNPAAEQQRAEPQYQRITIPEYVISSLTLNISNRSISDTIPDHIRLSEPIERYRRLFEYKTNGISGLIANHYGVFDPVHAAGRTITPKQTIDELFDKAQESYELIVQRVNSVAQNAVRGDFTYNPKHFATKEGHLHWHTQFSALLKQQGELAQDIAQWLQQLAARDDIVGRKVHEKLRAHGITQPQSLEADVAQLSKNALRFYESYERHQLNAYSNTFIR